MFTIKLHGHDGRRLIRSADSFTILADDMRGFYEVTLHSGCESCRFDIGEDMPREEGWPPLMSAAFIMNEAGQTVEILRSYSGPSPRSHQKPIKTANAGEWMGT
jgi:hypothetical protein